jgi:transformation/transcription domain-associated protein
MLLYYKEYLSSYNIYLCVQISTLLLEHTAPLFKLFKKDIIKFAWSHIKCEDSTTRQWAYINICRFVSSFESPPKIITQVRFTPFLFT